MKTKLFLTLGIILSFILTGCGKKEVKILSPEIEGDLKGCFKVLDSVCEVVKDDNGNPAIVVNIQRTDESVPFTPETVSSFTENNTKAFVLAGFGYEGYDKNSDLTGELFADENDNFTEQQLQILQLQPGQKGILTIPFDKDIPENIILTSQLKFLSTGEITLNGAIGRYGIKNFTIEFNFKKNKISGQYQYLTSPAGAYLYLIGNIASDKLVPGDYSFNILIAEDNGRNELSGRFKGQLKLVRDSKTSPYYYVLLGTFINKHYQDFRYDLKSAPLNEIQYKDILKGTYAASMDPSFMSKDFSGFRSYSDEAAYSGYSDDDLTAADWLRAYKNFYRKMIRVIEKMNHNDPRAVIEYTELIGEYYDFVGRMEEMKGDLTPSQLNEFMKLNHELQSKISKLK